MCVDQYGEYTHWCNRQVNYNGRTISYRAQGRIHSLDEPWVYDGTAWDIQSGIKAKVKHYEQSGDAVKDAVAEVIKKLKEQGIIKDWFSTSFTSESTPYIGGKDGPIPHTDTKYSIPMIPRSDRKLSIPAKSIDYFDTARDLPRFNLPRLTADK